MRPTTQTQPFVPLTAVTYPVLVMTRMVARSEIDAGPALRAISISAARGMRYCETGAIAG